MAHRWVSLSVTMREATSGITSELTGESGAYMSDFRETIITFDQATLKRGYNTLQLLHDLRSSFFNAYNVSPTINLIAKTVKFCNGTRINNKEWTTQETNKN